MNSTPDNLLWVDTSELGIDDATRVVGERLLAATAAHTYFAAVILMPPNPGSRMRALINVRERVRMLKRIRPGLRQWCKGLVFVASADMQRDNAKAIRAGQKMWGCPTWATDDPDAARHWAEAQLSAE